MMMDGPPGYPDGLNRGFPTGAPNSWMRHSGPGERSAEYRARQRSQRGPGHHQPPPTTRADWMHSAPSPSWATPSWVNYKPPPPPLVQGRKAVWVLVFNAGQHDEGV